MLPMNWRNDPEMAGLPPAAQLIFVSLVELCQVANNGGVMTWAQVDAVCRGYARGRAALRRLIAAGALLERRWKDEDKQKIVQGKDAGETVLCIANAPRWLFISNTPASIPAAQRGSSGASGVQAQPRARAHVKKDREIDRESIRSPSGSDRMDSARAAPRGAEGAARPAPEQLPAGGSLVGDDLPKMTRAEAIAAARKAIRQGQQNSPHCTGRDISFSRYDPNREIVPLKSGFSLGGETK